jgi:hypothetical protein
MAWLAQIGETQVQTHGGRATEPGVLTFQATFFWPIIFRCGCDLRGSSAPRFLGIETLVPSVPSSGCKETLKSVSGEVGYQKHRLRLCIRLSSERHRSRR